MSKRVSKRWSWHNLRPVIEYRAGHRVTDIELGEIIGVSRDAVRVAWREGFLIDDLLTIARHFGVNPAELLVRVGALEVSEVTKAALNFAAEEGVFGSD